MFGYMKGGIFHIKSSSPVSFTGMVVPREKVLPLTFYISDMKLLLFGLLLFQGIRKEQK